MKRRKWLAALLLTVVFGATSGAIALLWFLQTATGPKKISAWMMGAEYLGSDGVVLQTTHNNCGPSALQMVFDHYKIRSTMAEIEGHVGITEQGTSMLALKEMAELKGLRAEGWRLTLEDFGRTALPAILFVQGDHFVVSDSVDRAGFVYLRDPALGRLKLRKAKLQRMWNGETLVFEKSGHAQMGSH